MKRVRCKVYLRIVTFARAMNPNPINLNERTDDMSFKNSMKVFCLFSAIFIGWSILLICVGLFGINAHPVPAYGFGLFFGFLLMLVSVLPFIPWMEGMGK